MTMDAPLHGMEVDPWSPQSKPSLLVRSTLADLAVLMLPTVGLFIML